MAPVMAWEDEVGNPYCEQSMMTCVQKAVGGQQGCSDGLLFLPKEQLLNKVSARGIPQQLLFDLRPTR